MQIDRRDIPEIRQQTRLIDEEFANVSSVAEFIFAITLNSTFFGGSMISSFIDFTSLTQSGTRSAPVTDRVQNNSWTYKQLLEAIPQIQSTNLRTLCGKVPNQQ
jgi:hypothetical protein